MKTFSEFIVEEVAGAPEGKSLKHISHLEDLPIHQGHEGVGIASQILDDVHKTLLGHTTSTHISTKYDGSPSVVFGNDPKTGKFFVASKSAFNKTPKINIMHEEIDQNHGHVPGLAKKLKAAHDHLSKIMPASGGVYQGDIMHTPEDLSIKKGHTSFTPNTITYSVPSDSEHGKKARASKIGIVVHTKYYGRGDVKSLSAAPLTDKERSAFADHPDVHNIDPTIKVNTNNYTPEEQKNFLAHREQATKTYRQMKPESVDAIRGHETNLEAHINDMIKRSDEPSADGYIQHLTNRGNKAAEKLKTSAGKEKRSQASAKNVQHVFDNRDHFDKVLKLQNHLQNAKNILTGVMAKNGDFAHSINGSPTGPEGAVAVDKDGNMVKLIDRQEFSRQNLLRSRGTKK